MKSYEIIEIMGNFETLVGNTFKATSEQEVKKLIMEWIKDNINEYLYPVVEIKDED